MAKHAGMIEVDKGANNVFKFGTDNTHKIVSRVFTLDVIGPDGKIVKNAGAKHTFDAGSEALMTKKRRMLINADGSPQLDANGEQKFDEVSEHRFKKIRYVPGLSGQVSAATTVDEFAMMIADWARALEQFDGADSFELPNGKRIKRTYRVLTDGKKDPKQLTAVQYIAEILLEGHTLRNNKPLQQLARVEAERTLRAEYGIGEPPAVTKAAKVAKVESQYADEEEEVA